MSLHASELLVGRVQPLKRMMASQDIEQGQPLAVGISPPALLSEGFIFI